MAESFEVRVYEDMLRVGAEETFGDIRKRTHGVPNDVPAAAVHQDGEHGTFQDKDVIVEELGAPLVGWCIVFEEAPLKEYVEYRYPQDFVD